MAQWSTALAALTKETMFNFQHHMVAYNPQ